MNVLTANGVIPEVLFTKIGFDGDDRGSRVVAAALRDAGMKVIDTPPWQEIAAVVKLATEEDVGFIVPDEAEQLLLDAGMPGWVVFRDSLPTTPTHRIQKNLIFEEGDDPRQGAFDCRAMKSRTAVS